MIKLDSKRGYEFGFAWLFAIIIGAVVIFLAIYIAVQIVQTKQLEQETFQGKQIGVLLTPVETNLEQAKSAIISVPDETKVFNGCENPSLGNPFGSQKISVATKKAFSDEWDDSQGIESTFHNKYLFSDSPVQSDKEFYALSKPFKLPFKIADLIILLNDKQKYCFDQNTIPYEVKKELNDLAIPSIEIKPLSQCSQESLTVCFSSSCDISVSIDGNSKQGTVIHKNIPPIYYINSLGSDKFGMMYSAIFSDSTIYNCQVQRLMAHVSLLSKIYDANLDYLDPISSCSFSGLNNALEALRTSASTASSQLNKNALQDVYEKAEEVWNQNERITCKLFQ